MQKLVARAMVVMLLVWSLGGLFMARPAQARGRTGTILLIGAIAGGIYYLVHRRQEKRERSAVLTYNSKYFQPNRVARSSRVIATPDSAAAATSSVTSESPAESTPMSGSADQ